MTAPGIQTLLFLPDGTQREYTSNSTDIRAYVVQGDPTPRFEIDGHRYTIGSVQEFGYLSDYAGPVRILDLVMLVPTNN